MAKEAGAASPQRQEKSSAYLPLFFVHLTESIALISASPRRRHAYFIQPCIRLEFFGEREAR